MNTTALTPDALKQQAMQATGLSNWGDTQFDEALEKLCQAARDDAKLSGVAFERFTGLIINLLSNRLKITDDRQRYPEIAQQKIIAPLIVIGLPRSGTTILHSLLAQDPDARSPLTWEVSQPSPPPRAETYTSDPRIAQSEAVINSLDPQFRAMHAMGATLPEECNSFMSMAFQSMNFGAINALPSYSHWMVEENDIRSAYDFHYQVLQHFQAFKAGKHWVLKSPTHLFWLSALLETYPDARIVVTHRDPAQVLPSNTSLIAHIRASACKVDPIALGQQQQREWHTALRRSMEFRDKHPHKGQFFDAHYQQIINDPISLIESIYTHFGMTLSDTARTNMTEFLANNKQGKHGAHHYTAEQFGMSVEGLHREFGDYIQRYQIDLGR